MTDETPLASELHAVYCHLTGLTVPLSIQRIFAWSAWAKEFDVKDLRMVVGWLQGQIRQKRKWPSCLLFSRLIADREEFAEHLSMARAEARLSKEPMDLKRVLVATGRQGKEEPVMVNVKTPAQILAASKAFEEFRALKHTL